MIGGVLIIIAGLAFLGAVFRDFTARKQERLAIDAYVSAERERCLGHARHLGAIATASAILSGKPAPTPRRARLRLVAPVPDAVEPTDRDVEPKESA